MIYYKTQEDLEKMRQGGKILAQVLSAVMEHAKPGVSELELDTLAEKLILEKGGAPGFKKVAGYKHTICVSTNDVVVHGVPTEYKLKDGDVFGVDCGVYYKGFHTDMAQTVRIATGPAAPSSHPTSSIKVLGPAALRVSLRALDGTPSGRVTRSLESPDKIDNFLETGEKALLEGIKQAKIGNRVGHISKTIQTIVEGQGYSVVRSLIGHGVGRNLHEDPEVPGFLNKKIEKTPELIEGMTIAIEVIYNLGKKEVVYANKDGWTIKTQDNNISGLFERTVSITKQGPLILTQ